MNRRAQLVVWAVSRHLPSPRSRTSPRPSFCSTRLRIPVSRSSRRIHLAGAFSHSRPSDIIDDTADHHPKSRCWGALQTARAGSRHEALPSWTCRLPRCDHRPGSRPRPAKTRRIVVRRAGWAEYDRSPPKTSMLGLETRPPPHSIRAGSSARAGLAARFCVVIKLARVPDLRRPAGGW